MPTAVVTDVSSFTIRELTGAQRVVQLVGRALPYRPFSLKTRQRVEIDWYAGNPEGTATILGAAEAPSSINGMWKTKFLGEFEATTGGNLRPFTLNGAGVQSARDAVFFMDEIVRAGQLLEVTWDEITRHGHLTEFDQSWHNVYDVEWTMRFEWISRGEPTSPPVYLVSASIASTATEMQQYATSLSTAIQPPSTLPVNTGPSAFAVTVASQVSEVQDTVLKIQGAVSNVAALAMTPLDAARAVIANGNALIAQTQAIISNASSFVPAAVNSVQTIDQQSFGMRLLAARYVDGIKRVALAMRNAFILQRAPLTQQIQSTLLAIHTAKDGEDLREVSRLYYNTPFEWRRLMLFNELTTTVLVAQQLVMIPKITSDVNGGTQS